MSLCLYPQNRLFFGRTIDESSSLSPKPPVFRTNRRWRFVFIPKTACFSDEPSMALRLYPQNRLFFGRTVDGASSLSPKPPVFRTARGRFCFLIVSLSRAYIGQQKKEPLIAAPKFNCNIKAPKRVEYTCADHTLGLMRTNLWGLNRRVCNG